MAIVRIVEEKEDKEDKEEDLIELRVVEKMVPRWFHKYLKVFEKKESERMLMRKVWNHTINLREDFVLKKGKIYSLSRVEIYSLSRVEIYSLSRVERESARICEGLVEKGIHQAGHQSHYRCHQCSLCQRRMEKRGWCKIIDI